uniref:Ribosomal_L7Ae domain-containing protein n=1 Tax=Caenorhabditis tropicalis TaxID=1561998 RepID=A0A1I7UIY5_9PELO
MSIDRGDRIIVMMVRSLCCCRKTTQVADSSEEVARKQLLTNVFIVCKQNVFTRNLLGKLIAALEDRHLLPVQMKIGRPTQEMIDKSHLMKEERRRQLDEVWMVLVVRGREAQTRVSECIKGFEAQYALHENDICWTENDKLANEEEEIWFKNNDVVEMVVNGEGVAVENGGGEAANVLVVEAIEENVLPAPVELSVASLKIEPDHSSEANSIVSSEGPIMSIPSSQIQSPIPPNSIGFENPIKSIEMKDDVEVISNTAEILQAAPSPVPVVAVVPIINQPTTVE